MHSNTALTKSSASRLRSAIVEVAEAPLPSLLSALSLVLVVILAPIWGSAYAAIGWMESKRRLQREGLAGLGSVLAPEIGRAQYRDGLWSGIWRAQKLGLSVLLIELPTVVLALLPAAAVYALIKPAAMLFEMEVALALEYGVPGIIALLSLVIVNAQVMLMLRILAEARGERSIGLVFRASAESWEATLAQTKHLLGLGFGFLALAILSGVLVGGSLELAKELGVMGAFQVILMWTGTVAIAFLSATTLTALFSWTEDVRIESLVASSGDFSFTRWLQAWLSGALRWLSEQGVITVGIGACLIVGTLTGLVALVTGKNFESWVGLGWFAVTAATLVVLNGQRRHA